MELTDIRSTDYGTYTCTATNKAGSVSTSFDIIEDSEENKMKPRFTTHLKVKR